MSIQMTLIFGLLVSEIAIISLLLVPLPTKIQSTICTKYTEVLTNPNLKIIIPFVDVLVGILFMDAFKNGFGMFKSDDMIEFGAGYWEKRVKKFYSQRNLYILGAVLFLQMCIWCLMMLLKSLVKNKGKLVNGIDQVSDAEVEKLQANVDILKKQYDNLHKEYQDKKGEAVKTNEDKKDD